MSLRSCRVAALVIAACLLIPLAASAQSSASTPQIALADRLAQIAADPATQIFYGDDAIYSEHCDDDGKKAFAPINSDYRQIVFLNFDGQALRKGGSNSKNNTTSLILGSSFNYPAMDWSKFSGAQGDATKGKKLVMDELKILFLGVAVEFVTTRPDSGDYTMSMIGGNGQGLVRASGGTVGVSPLDCKNSNKNDVNVVFGSRLNDPKRMAFVIAHELGHSFGLEHVSEKKGIMYPGLNSATCCWASAGVVGSGRCRRQQDSKKVLIDNLGAGEGDKVAPLVWFIRPGEGAVLPPSFSFEVDARDDLKIHHVTLYLDKGKADEQKLELKQAPYVAAFADVKDGEHTLRAEAFDWNPNVSSAEITVRVDKGCPAGATCKNGTKPAGDECKEPSDCTSKICAQKEGKGQCVESCKDAKSVCPTGTTCKDTDGKWACIAGTGWTVFDAVSDSGCDVAGAQPAPPIVPLAIVGFGLLIWLRRRS